MLLSCLRTLHERPWEGQKERKFTQNGKSHQIRLLVML